MSNSTKEKVAGNVSNIKRLLHSGISKPLILPAIYLAVSIGLVWNPLQFFSVNSFDRQIGQALINGIDIAKRINVMTIWGFFYYIALSAIVYIILKLLFNRSMPADVDLRFLNAIILAAGAVLVVSLFNRFVNLRFYDFLAGAMVMSVVVILACRRRKPDHESLKWSVFTAIPLLIFVVEAAWASGFGIKTGDIGSILLAAGYGLLILLLYFLVTTINVDRRARFRRASTPLYFAPVLLSLFIEAYNILNQYEVFLPKKSLWGIGIFLICIFSCLIPYYNRSDMLRDSNDAKRWQYPLLVLGVALLTHQAKMQIFSLSELFETSNQGTALFELFSHSEIPIIQNFDAHMLSSEIGNIFYGILNSDPLGAIYFGYDAAPIVYLLFYYLLKELTDNDALSLLLVLLFPCKQDYCFTYCGMGVLVYLAAVYAYQHRSKRGYILFFIICVLECLYRIDIGFSMAIAAAVILLIFSLFDADRKKLVPKYLASGAVVTLLSVAMWTVLCIWKGVSPLSRALEFLNIAQSNTRWAFTEVGDSTQAIFLISYLIVPAAVAAITLIVFLGKSEKNTKQHMIFAMLALSYFLSYSRSLVRHGVFEKMWGFVFWTAALTVAVGMYLIKKRSKFVFVGSWVVMLLLLQLLCNNGNVAGSSLMQAQSSQLMSTDQRVEYSEKVDRVLITDDTKNRYEALKYFLDATLDDDETYLDFTNQTLLYALTDRRKPVYTDQSTCLLGGEYSQLMFIQEIESEDCPYALVRSYQDGIDGIPSSVSSYLTSEYLYSHYKPLCIEAGYQVWVKKDSYEEKRAIIKNLMTEFSVIDITEKYVEGLEPLQTTVNYGNGEISLNQTAGDPGAMGFEENAGLRLAMASNEAILLRLNYSSTVPGLFQCFYTTEEGETFSEDKSVRIDVGEKGVITFTIPCTSFTKLRFDIPDNSGFTIGNIEYSTNTAAVFLKDLTFIDYYCEGITHTYSLAELPYIWGTYDDAESQTVLAEVASDGDFGAKSLDTGSGNYIEIYTSAQTNGIGTVTVLRPDGTPAIVVNMNIHEGRNRYLVRVSWDSLWYSGEMDTVHFSSDIETSETDISVLKGDTNLNGIYEYALQNAFG